jgi:hypothetical protein
MAIDPGQRKLAFFALSIYSSIMNRIAYFVLAALVAVVAGCREETSLTILFAGDERGWIVPAG